MQFKQHISELPQKIHGGIDYAGLISAGINPGTILDFSVNSNPYGPPPGIKEIISRTSISDYPDSNATILKEALAEKCGLNPENILVGSGSTEIIRLIAMGFFSPGDKIIIPAPTYSEYEIASRIMEAQIIFTVSSEDSQFYLNVNSLMEQIDKNKPAALFLCNPNNPTGQYLTRKDITDILTVCDKTTMILDEAYIAFTEGMWSSLELLRNANLVILRSMTKDYALAGLRLGYALANPSIISILKKMSPPWNISTVAQAAGLYVLRNDEYLEQCKLKIKRDRDYLMQQLASLDFEIIPSQSNFFLLKAGNAKKFREALLKKNILVRDCTSFGLPQYVRISPRTLAECKKFIVALKEISMEKQ